MKALLLLSMTALCAFADLAVTLTPGAQLANRDTDTVFTGTLTNTGSADIFLNDLVFKLVASAPTYLTVDRNFFFQSVPGVLSPGETYSGPIFKMAVAKAPSGTYVGSISVLGGADIFAMDILPSSASFTVQVVHRPPKRVR